MIRIKSDIGSRTIRIEDSAGRPIPDVAECKIELAPGGLATASLTLLCEYIDVVAIPIIERALLEDLAAAHGLRLVPIANGVDE